MSCGVALLWCVMWGEYCGMECVGGVVFGGVALLSVVGVLCCVVWMCCVV